MKRIPYWTALVILVLLGSLPYLTTEYTTVEPPPVPIGIFGTDNQIIVLDTKLTEDLGQAQAQAELDIVWQVVQPVDFDYNVFFQALDSGDGEPTVISQLDTQPLQGVHPASTWQPGDIYKDSYRLDLSANQIQDKELRYYFGYYDWRTGERMPLNGGIDDKLEFYGQ